MVEEDHHSALSPRALTVWAKSVVDPEQPGVLRGWLPLHQHLDDSAAVANKLWKEWLPENVKKLIAAPFGGSYEVTQRLYTWIASTHDVGKASPAFAVQVPDLAETMQRSGFTMDFSLRGTDERRQARHELVSYLAMSERLCTTHNFEKNTAKGYASIIGTHHGNPLTRQGIDHVGLNARLFGRGAWDEVRQEFLRRAEQLHLEEGDLALFRETKLPQTVQVLLSGMVIVADWIASNEELFPYARPGESIEETTAERLEHAWQQLELPGPWRLSKPPMELTEHFSQRFSLPPQTTPRPLQTALYDAANSAPCAELFILEAPMGSGKTEAALAAAEVLAATTQAGGIFIALPTQATSDAMLARTYEWLKALPTSSTLFLGHGKSQLNAQYSGLLRDAYQRAAGIGSEPRSRKVTDDDVVAHQWLTGSKRGSLANVMVGTVDQGLFLALCSKHLMLRHLALAGKVVIIDEVHSYSAYMNVYLNQLLHWLGAYGVPVILLSATLPGAQREAMLRAYDDGRRRSQGSYSARRAERDAIRQSYNFLAEDIGYPVITHTRNGELPAIRKIDSDGRGINIDLERIADSSQAVAETLQEALVEGGCAVVIHNTVARVQETANYLQQHFGEDTEIIVAHSRFLSIDRSAKDALLLDKFGSQSRAKQRPHKAIVVASQVVEQSLDIDFDVMVSDLAPIDLIFQRAGRLHRHQRGLNQVERPQPLRKARLILTGVDWAATLPEPAKKYQKVYYLHILYRTLVVLDSLKTLTIPEDIPRLVQEVYGPDQLGAPAWQESMLEAERDYLREVKSKQEEARVFRLGDVPTEPASLADWNQRSIGDLKDTVKAQATVRDSSPTLEVLVLCRDDVGNLITPPWLAKHAAIPLPLNQAPPPWLSKIILSCSLTLPATMCFGNKIDQLIDELEKQTRIQLPEWQASRELRDELAIVLDSEHKVELLEYSLSYSPDRGLDVNNLD
ncbi:CRISPR-associated helicase Cas3' [Psychromicrobium sp. YIM B11713]|uniref:CRISPR-associated helicase Cas3' n=1 Tax=Psychromicrobium sp. YIM B11713 TaxID=3145233 RepID=UPI00374ED0C5